MLNRTTLVISILAAAAAALPAQATELSYNYAELRFVDTEIGSADGDGLRLNGSFEMTDEWLLVGGYTTLDFDGNVDTSALEIGAGYVHRYSPRLDIVGYGKLVRTTIDFTGGDDDDTGISLAGGVRGTFTPEFEGRATINYFNVDETDTFFEVGADYYITPQFSAGGTLEFGGDADTLTLGVRWFFTN